MSEEKREFKGVWIPKEIWLNPDLSALEKCVLAEIDSLDNDEKGCFASNEYFGKFFGVSEGRAANIISDLKKRGHVFQTFFDGRNRGLRISKSESSVHENVKPPFTKTLKQTSRKREHNNTVNNPNNNPNYASPTAEKASAPKTPWTKEVSTLFDKINEEAHRAANLEYGPFNWAAGGGRQFAALKKIRDAMIPDIERKLHHAPDEKEIQSGFEYLFRYGFEFFKKVADDKGGAINFTPSAILNSYNLILSHARASHTPRKSKQEQRIDNQHEARAAFYRELVSDLVETGDGGG